MLVCFTQSGVGLPLLLTVDSFVDTQFMCSSSADVDCICPVMVL
jgi:hypothetical protein